MRSDCVLATGEDSRLSSCGVHGTQTTAVSRKRTVHWGRFLLCGQFSSTPVPGFYPTGIVAGDFNRDGIMDLAVVSTCSTNQCYPVAIPQAPGFVTIFLGDGMGGFTASGSQLHRRMAELPRAPFRSTTAARRLVRRVFRAPPRRFPFPEQCYPRELIPSRRITTGTPTMRRAHRRLKTRW